MHLTAYSPIVFTRVIYPLPYLQNRVSVLLYVPCLEDNALRIIHAHLEHRGVKAYTSQGRSVDIYIP